MKKILITITIIFSFAVAKAQNLDTVKNNTSDTTIVDNPTIKPEFPRGKEKFYKFLSKTVGYPAKAKEHNT
jgi:hypothetical protein